MALTKSLHTVTVVSRLAAKLRETNPLLQDPVRAVTMALVWLGQETNVVLEDATYLACVKATQKLIGEKS